MSRIRIANPQPGTAKYTTASRAERYVRRKEALIIGGELHFLSPTEQRRLRTLNHAIQSERRAGDVCVDRRADEEGAIWWNGSDTRRTAMHRPGENVQFANSYVAAIRAGCGGSSLVYSMAGYRELLAVEWDDHAVATFRLNFPDVPVWHGDIADLSVEKCLELARLRPEELDVLDGSPPCQGFSTAGKRKMEDGRNQLFREYVRLLRGLRPKLLVMENISGMAMGKMKLIFAEILRELKASGYHVSARLMNAMYYGVPQSRQDDDLRRREGRPVALHSKPVTLPAAAGALLRGRREASVVELPERARVGSSKAQKPGVPCNGFILSGGTHFRLNFSAKAISSAAPSPRHALPCMQASIAGRSRASRSRISVVFGACA